MIRRYRCTLTTARLDRMCNGNPSIVACSGLTIDVDAGTAAIDDLDDAMLDFGFVAVEDDPTTTCGPLLPSPDGTMWRLEVDNSGNLTTAQEAAIGVTPP